MPIHEVRTLESLLADALAPERFMLALLATFASVAIVLAAIGVYGTTWQAVRRRTGEIGVRIALGADRREIQSWILLLAMRAVGAGALIGLAGALIAGRLLRGLLFGVAPGDPLTLALVAATLLLVPLLVALRPARRAALTDPARALQDPA